MSSDWVFELIVIVMAMVAATLRWWWPDETAGSDRRALIGAIAGALGAVAGLILGLPIVLAWGTSAAAEAIAYVICLFPPVVLFTIGPLVGYLGGLAARVYLGPAAKRSRRSSMHAHLPRAVASVSAVFAGPDAVPRRIAAMAAFLVGLASGVGVSLWLVSEYG